MRKDGLKIKSVKNSDTGQFGALVNIQIKSRNYRHLPEFREGGDGWDGSFHPDRLSELPDRAGAAWRRGSRCCMGLGIAETKRGGTLSAPPLCLKRESNLYSRS